MPKNRHFYLLPELLGRVDYPAVRTAHGGILAGPVFRICIIDFGTVYVVADVYADGEGKYGVVGGVCTVDSCQVYAVEVCIFEPLLKFAFVLKIELQRVVREYHNHKIKSYLSNIAGVTGKFKKHDEKAKPP